MGKRSLKAAYGKLRPSTQEVPRICSGTGLLEESGLSGRSHRGPAGAPADTRSSKDNEGKLRSLRISGEPRLLSFTRTPDTKPLLSKSEILAEPHSFVQTNDDFLV